MHSCEFHRALNIGPLLQIERPQLHWFGHVSRMTHEILARQVLLAEPTGKWSRGHPSTRWSEYISELAWSHLGVEPAELPEIAVDCEVFRVLLGLLPQIHPREKAGIKMNEYNAWPCNNFEFTFQLIATGLLNTVGFHNLKYQGQGILSNKKHFYLPQLYKFL